MTIYAPEGRARTDAVSVSEVMDSIVTQFAVSLDLSAGKKTDVSPLVLSDSNTYLSHNSFIMQTIKCVVVGDGAVGKWVPSHIIASRIKLTLPSTHLPVEPVC